MPIGIAADPGGFELKVQLISRGPNGSGAVLTEWRRWEKRNKSINKESGSLTSVSSYCRNIFIDNN